MRTEPDGDSMGGDVSGLLRRFLALSLFGGDKKLLDRSLLDERTSHLETREVALRRSSQGLVLCSPPEGNNVNWNRNNDVNY